MTVRELFGRFRDMILPDLLREPPNAQDRIKLNASVDEWQSQVVPKEATLARILRIDRSMTKRRAKMYAGSLEPEPSWPPVAGEHLSLVTDKVRSFALRVGELPDQWGEGRLRSHVDIAAQTSFILDRLVFHILHDGEVAEPDLDVWNSRYQLVDACRQQMCAALDIITRHADACEALEIHEAWIRVVETEGGGNSADAEPEKSRIRRFRAHHSGLKAAR